MKRRRPDPRWRSPVFALRRLLRLTTTDRSGYGLTADPDVLAAVAERARAAAASGGPRAALLFSPTPRSGTNYVEAIVTAHPHIAAAPCGLREAPFLASAEAIRGFEAALAGRDPESAAQAVPYEWLAYAAAGFLARAAREAGEGARTILLKDPFALRLDLAEAVFPDARRLVVFRDGRRTLDSRVRTWPLRRFGRSFEDLCLEWALAADAALDHVARSDGEAMAIRYEDAVAQPAVVARAAQAFLGLDPGLARISDLRATPVRGSSTHSRADGAVDWAPRKAPKGFDPAHRAVDWPKKWERTFQRVCAATQARLDAEIPLGGVQSQSRSTGIRGMSAGGMG